METHRVDAAPPNRSPVGALGAGGIGVITVVAVLGLVLWGGGGAPSASRGLTSGPSGLTTGGTPSNGVGPGVFSSGPAASGSTGSSSNTPPHQRRRRTPRCCLRRPVE